MFGNWGVRNTLTRISSSLSAALRFLSSFSRLSAMVFLRSTTFSVAPFELSVVVAPTEVMIITRRLVVSVRVGVITDEDGLVAVGKVCRLVEGIPRDRVFHGDLALAVSLTMVRFGWLIVAIVDLLGVCDGLSAVANQRPRVFGCAAIRWCGRYLVGAL